MKFRDDTGLRRGFTLFEVVVAIAVTSVVSTLAVLAFNELTAYWRYIEGRAELDAIADAAFEDIGRDVHNVISARISGATIRGTSNEYRNQALHLDRTFANDQVTLPILTQTAQGWNVPQAVMYRVDRTGSTHRLMRTAGGVLADEPEGGALAVVSRANVLRFRVEYGAPDGGWAPNWANRPRHPRALRVSMTLADVNRPDIQVVRTAVYSIEAN